jgi:hypothetical protein
MLSEPAIVGIYIGIALSCIFLAVNFKKRKVPKFNEVVLILLGAVGGTLGADFGYLMLTCDATVIGPFKDHRITMLLGALAVVWTSCESLVQIYLPLFNKNLKAPVLREVAEASAQPDASSGQPASPSAR